MKKRATNEQTDQNKTNGEIVLYVEENCYFKGLFSRNTVLVIQDKNVTLYAFISAIFIIISAIANIWKISG